MFDWIGDYASWAWDSGFGAVALFCVSVLALAVAVLAVIAGVVQLASWFGQGFRRGATKAKAEQD